MHDPRWQGKLCSSISGTSSAIGSGSTWLELNFWVFGNGKESFAAALAAQDLQ
jgi:hypothetical protein